MTWKCVSSFQIDSKYRFRWQATNAMKKLQKQNPSEKYYIMEIVNPKPDDSDRYSVCYGHREVA